MKRFVYPLITALLALPVAAAPPATGPVVPNFGPVMAPPADAFNLVPGTRYKVSLDVATTGDFVEDRNRMLESAARFMNMHARNGIDPKDIDFALVVHGAATRDLLTDEVYRERFGDEPAAQSILGYVFADLVTIALERAGTELTVEKFTAALESIDAYQDSFGGPSLSLSPTKHVASDYLNLYQVRDRRWVTLIENLPF